MTVVTMFIQDLSFLLDKKVEFSVEEVNKHIEDKDVIDWLEETFPNGSEKGLDFSLWENKHRNWLHEKLENIWGGYAGSERRKWGIENNGLCLLISWATEIVRECDFDTKEDAWL